MFIAPGISSDELSTRIKELIPDVQLELTVVNAQYKSYSLRVRTDKIDLEFVWGPLSGFGGSDHARPAETDDTPFDYADVAFHSLTEAIHYLTEMHKKYD